MEPRDIIKLITACSGKGVAEIRFGDLTLRFFENSQENNSDLVNSSQTWSKRKPTPQKLEQMELIAKEADEKAKAKEAEEELSELMIMQPEKYEELLATGELVDDPQIQH